MVHAADCMFALWVPAHTISDFLLNIISGEYYKIFPFFFYSSICLARQSNHLCSEHELASSRLGNVKLYCCKAVPRSTLFAAFQDHVDGIVHSRLAADVHHTQFPSFSPNAYPNSIRTSPTYVNCVMCFAYVVAHQGLRQCYRGTTMTYTTPRIFTGPWHRSTCCPTPSPSSSPCTMLSIRYRWWSYFGEQIITYNVFRSSCDTRTHPPNPKRWW